MAGQVALGLNSGIYSTDNSPNAFLFAYFAYLAVHLLSDFCFLLSQCLLLSLRIQLSSGLSRARLDVAQ